MRRLSAVLMIAALFAALVPSATMAGKPVPGIDKVEVYGKAMSGKCWVEVRLWWHGRAPRAIVVQEPGNQRGMSIDNKTHYASMLYWDADRTENLGSVTYQWWVSLADRKDNPIGTAVIAGPDDFDGDSCPNRMIASWG